MHVTSRIDMHRPKTIGMNNSYYITKAFPHKRRDTQHKNYTNIAIALTADIDPVRDLVYVAHFFVSSSSAASCGILLDAVQNRTLQYRNINPCPLYIYTQRD